MAEPTRGESAVSVRDMVLGHDRDIDILKGWKRELEGAFKFMKVAFGTSIISAIVSIVTLVVLLGVGQQ